MFKIYTAERNRMLTKANRSGLHAALVVAALILQLAGGRGIRAQEVNWSASFGNSYNDESYAACRVTGGGYATIGSTYASDGTNIDIYLVRLDDQGDTLWSARYGGDSTDIGYDIQEALGGGFIIAGTTASYGAGKRDVYLLRTDDLGAVIWARTYGGAEHDRGWSVRRASDSGFVVCGTTGSFGAGYDDIYLLRLNANGDTLWTRTYGGPGGDLGFAVRPTPDSAYIIAGTTGSFGEGYSSIYAVKTDTDGDTLWTRTYGGAKADAGYSVEVALDGGYMFAGSSSSFGNEYSDAYLVKTDAGGAVQWDRTYGGIRDDRAYAVSATDDGGYLLAGITESFGAGRFDVYLVKADPLGDTLWSV